MPLVAQSNRGLLASWKYDAPAWEKLKSLRDELDLQMDCCGVAAIMKTSVRGTPFFAHKARSECKVKSESPEHLYLTTIIARAAEDTGWEVHLNQLSSSASGADIIIPLLCLRGRAKIAVELQWTQKPSQEQVERQLHYQRTGVRYLTLKLARQSCVMTHFKSSNSKEDPSFFFEITHDWQFRMQHFTVDVDYFVRGAFSGMLQWFPADDDQIEIDLSAIDVFCSECGCLGPCLSSAIFTSEEPRIEKRMKADPAFLEWMVHKGIAAEIPGDVMGELRLVSRFFRDGGIPKHFRTCLHCGEVLKILATESDKDPKERDLWECSIALKDVPFDIFRGWTFELAPMSEDAWGRHR